MTKPSDSWKAYERMICKIFNSKRRGADYADKEGGKNDCLSDDWSIEIKYLARPSWGVMQENVQNARKRAKPGQIPIGVVRKKGEGSVEENTLVMMSLKDYREWFVNENKVGTENQDATRKEN